MTAMQPASEVAGQITKDFGELTAMRWGKLHDEVSAALESARVEGAQAALEWATEQSATIPGNKGFTLRFAFMQADPAAVICAAGKESHP